MLAYLQRLRMALVTRNALEARRLLNHPLSTMLSLRAREEALAVTRGVVGDDWTPNALIALCAEAEQLLAEEQRPLERGAQLELPLGPMLGAFDMSLTIARAAALPQRRRTPRPMRVQRELRDVS
ncbi:MAG TPA: hypothetical protein VFS05_05220 [Gemmatimonadaceae bacterium]|nr:hypothetical protein [Gemmatimonadaceae bacterium]